MTQQIINVGPAANDGLGDPIRTAFIKTNDNFSQLYSIPQASPPATLEGTVGDFAGMYAYSSAYFYYCFANYTTGNSTIWAQVTQVANIAVSAISDGTSNVKLVGLNGDATVNINGTSNIAAFRTTGAYITGVVSATGNITGDYILGNGSQLTGISGVGNYSNSNVTSLLADFGSNTISTTGNITGAYFIGNGSQLTGISGVGNYSNSNVTSLLAAFGSNTISTTGSITSGNVNATQITAVTLSASGNITGQYFIGNGSQLTGLPAGYSNAEVAAYGEAGWSGNIIPSANVTYSLGNSTNWWANAWFGANTIYIGGVPVGVTGNILTVNGANVVTANASGTLNANDILVTGNITGAYLIGNGSQITGVTADSANAETLSGTFLAANVLASSLTSVGNLTNLSVVGTTTSGNLVTGGTVSAVGTATVGNVSTTGTVSATGNIQGGNVATGGTVSATGNIQGGNLYTSGDSSTTGNVTGGNVLTSGLVSAAGTATLGNVATAGTASATGNVTGGNLATGGTASVAGIATVGNLLTGGTVSATGNVSGGNLYTSGDSSTTGNVTGGNLYTSGLVSATGNVTGNNLIGNTLTGTLTTALQPAITQVGTLGALAVTAGINAGSLGVGGNTTLNNLNVTGLTNITGNITQLSGNSAQFFGDLDGFGALYAGLAFGYANLVQTVLQVSGNYDDYVQINLQNTDAGPSATADYVATADNGTDATYFVDMGIASSTFDGLSANIAGNSIVANDAYLYTVGNTQADPGGNLIIGAVTEGKIIKLVAGGGDTANIVATVSNIGVTVTGFLSATGNTIGNNLTAVNNVTAGNVLTSGTVSATGNVTSGNVLTNGAVSATGTATVGNVSTTGTVSAAGNVTGGNVVTAGIISAIGTLTSGNVLTSGAVSATGNVTSGNVVTAGIVTASGNVVGNYILGNGSQLTGIAIGTPTSISSGTSNIGFSSTGGNIVMSVAGTSTAIFDTSNNIVLGQGAARNTGKTGAVVIGANAGSGGVGYNSVAIGTQAAGTSSGDRTVAMGFAAGETNQGDSATAVGPTSGFSNQGAAAVALGQGAGFESQGERAIAIGDEAGSLNQGVSAIAIGNISGTNAQGAGAVAIGYLSGNTTQGVTAVAVGSQAGQTNQGTLSVAVGGLAGTNQQKARAVAVGYNAGGDTQSFGGVAMGYTAGWTTQGANAVAIGYLAGRTNQGANSIAIGAQAGLNNQVASSIIINARGIEINAANPGLYITPIRNDIGNTGNILTYNTSTLEATYSNTISIAGNISGSYILGNGALLTGIDSTSIRNGTSNVSIPVANGNITMSVANTANVVTVTANSVTVSGDIYATSGVYALADAVLGNTANASATKTRIVSFGANSYIQTGNGTSGTTGNVIFSPYSDATARVRIDTSSGNINATGNVAATNIGNITPTNFNQSPTQVLFGDGLWKNQQGSGMLNITKFDQGATGGTNLFIADGRLFAIKGQNNNYTSGLGVANPVIQNGLPNTYEIVFPNETVGTLTDAGSYGWSAYALFANGNLYTWGVNNYGQLGLGNTTNAQLPTLALTSVAQVYTHPSQMNNEPNYVRLIVRKTDNTYFGCGYDGEYQLGLGTTTNKTSFTALPWIPADAISVWNLGNYQGNLFVQKADGLISATGYNGYGQLGVNATSSPTTPLNSNLWLGGDVSMRIQYISYGGRYFNSGGTSNYYWIAMLLDNGTTSRLVGAGANLFGTLGTGNTTNSTVPVAPLTSTGLTGRISKIRNTGSSPGTMHVKMANGDLFTYGYNEWGAVGNGTTTLVTTPYKLLTGNCADIHNDQMGWIYYGYYSPGAIVQKTDGTYWCCGYNAQGQVGIGSTTGTITTLQQMSLPKGTVIKFVGTSNGSNDGINKFIVAADNTIWSWGYNGQYNINGTAASNYLVPVNFAPTALKGN